MRELESATTAVSMESIEIDLMKLKLLIELQFT